MKLFEISQTWGMDNLTELKKFILENCGPWIEKINGDLSQYKLYRGTKTNHGTAAVVPVRADRRPYDSSQIIHNMFNHMIERSGLVANRTNSAFCTGNKSVADSYGHLYVVIPVGKFHYTWSKNVSDWFAYINRTFHKHEDIDDEELVTKYYEKIYNHVDPIGDDGSLRDAILARHEIMISCEKLVMIEPKIYDLIFERPPQ